MRRNRKLIHASMDAHSHNTTHACRFWAVAALMATLGTQAQAESLNDIAAFAERICENKIGGTIARTTIDGNIKGDLPGLAKALGLQLKAGGVVKQDGSSYEGIPLDKLPSQIPTPAQCKKDLAELLIAERNRATSTAPVCTADTIKYEKGGSENDLVPLRPTDHFWLHGPRCVLAQSNSRIVKDSVVVESQSASDDKPEPHEVWGKVLIDSTDIKDDRFCYQLQCRGAPSYTCKLDFKIAWHELKFPNAACVTNTSVENSSSRIERDGFMFKLDGCEKAGDIVRCSYAVTNTQGDRDGRCQHAALVDSSGFAQKSQKASLGALRCVAGYSQTTPLVQGIATSGTLTFGKVATEVVKLVRLEFVLRWIDLSGKKVDTKVEWRDISLANPR